MYIVPLTYIEISDLYIQCDQTAQKYETNFDLYVRLNNLFWVNYFFVGLAYIKTITPCSK
jgi:hypothetical protein